MTVPVKDSLKIIPQGRLADFQVQLLRDGVAIDVSAKTITATFRRDGGRYAGTTLGAAWEDEACTLGNPTYTAANGGVRIQREIDPAVFLAPSDPSASYAYLVEFYIAGDDYSPQKLRFGVTRSLRST